MPIFCFVSFLNGSETPKQTINFFVSFAKMTKTEPKQIEFRFVSVRTKTKILLFRGHPNQEYVDTDGWVRVLFNVLGIIEKLSFCH